ncbi:MAG: (d)CMP kinase [Bacteroidales bacterium]|nr:(d)CMP kinase [Bacteroidales bacterium]
MKTIKIAIDGYSSCGKSTLAKSLATELKFLYIDSGAMYRAITFYALKNGIIDRSNTPDLELLKESLKKIDIRFQRMPKGNMHTILNGVDVENNIRSFGVSKSVSTISAIDFVRTEMVNLQRKLSENDSVVMDGRDIGTVVFPDADLKIFVTASPEVRAQRRYDELIAKGEEDISFEEIFENLKSRDKIDTTRAVSPLKKAEDAVLLDNSEMTIKEQFEYALNLVKQLDAYKDLTK